MGGFNTNSYNNRNLRFNWWINWQDVATNTTQIGWELRGSGSATGWFMSGNFSVWINGVHCHFSATRIQLYQNTWVAGGTLNIVHNSDGSKYFDAYAEAGIFTVAVNVSGSGGWWLPQIPRQANVTGAENVNDEGNPVMYFNNPGGFRIDAHLEHRGATISRLNIPNTGSYTFVLTEAERNSMRESLASSNSGSIRYTLTTVLNGVNTWWSWVDRTYSIVNANPTFSNFTHMDTNLITVGLTGNNQILIKGQSTLQVSVPMANRMVARKGATARTYNSIIDNRNISANFSSSTDVNMDLGTVETVGTRQLSVRAFDSRNNSTVVNRNIVVHEYNIPTINATVERQNNFEEQTTLRVSGTYSPLNIGGTNRNTIETNGVQYRQRQTGGSWSNWINLTRTLNANDGTFTCSNAVLTLNNTQSFEIEIRCIDNIRTLTNPVTVTRNVDVGIPALFISGNRKAIGVNCVPPSNAPNGSVWSNNVNLVDEINKLKQVDFLTYRFSGNLHVPSIWTLQKIPLNVIERIKGSRLSVSNNGIRIGAGVKTIAITAVCNWYNIDLVGDFNVHIVRNNTSISGSQGYINQPNTSLYAMATSKVNFLEVVEGDIIYLSASRGNTGNCRFFESTGLTVEVVEYR